MISTHFKLLLLLGLALFVSCNQSKPPASATLQGVQSSDKINLGLKLPYQGERGITGGPHSWSQTLLPNPSAIDIGGGGQSFEVLAATSGIVKPFKNDSCGFRIDNSVNGISTYYYHVKRLVNYDVQVTQGTYIADLQLCNTPYYHLHFGVSSGDTELAIRNYLIDGYIFTNNDQSPAPKAYDGWVFRMSDSNSCWILDNGICKANSSNSKVSNPQPPSDQPPAGYTKCADEDGTCSVSTKSNVIFGAQTSWTAAREFTSSTICNAATFGDPIPFTRKSCYSKPVGTTPPPSDQPPSGARQCASEGGRCNFSGTYTVWFGNNTTWRKQSYANGVDCKTENFGGTDPLPGVQKVCKTEGPDAPPPPLSGDQIIKTRSGNQVMDYSSGTLKLWTSVAGEGNQLFAWEPHQRGDMVLRSTKYNVCIEFPDSRSQGMKVVFTGCNKDEPKQQMIYDNGSYLGQDNGVPEWNIRPRKDSNWCLSTKDGTFDQGDEIVWQEGSCDGAERRWNYRGLTPPPPPSPPSWSVNPTSVTLPSGIVGGAITSGVFTITNAGGAGNFTVTSSNPYFTLSTASGSLSAGSSANVNVSAGACPSAGTQSGTVTVLGGGSSATVNISRVCAGAAVWTVNPASLTFTDAVGGGAPLGTSFLLQNSGSGAGSYAITANQAWVRFNRSSGTLNPGGSDTVGVEVDDCTTTGSQTAQILVSGGASAVVSVSRVCNAAPNPPPPPAPTPSVPSKVQIAMTSGGKMFVTWPEVSGTTAYEFAGTFDGQAVSISGQIPAQANATAGAIAQFMTAPDAADKQGKSICLSVRAVNGSGSSAYSSLGCAPYRYYTLSTLSVTAQDAYPRITVNR